jgi:hypothetical protein
MLQELVVDLDQARMGKIKIITVLDVNGKQHHIPVEENIRYEIIYNGTFALSYNHPERDELHLSGNRKYRHCPIYIAKSGLGHTGASNRINDTFWTGIKPRVDELQTAWTGSDLRRTLTSFLDNNLPSARIITKIVCIQLGDLVKPIIKQNSMVGGTI